MEGPSPETGTGTDLQTEGNYDRRLQLRLGGTVRGQTSVQLLVQPGEMPFYQLPGNDNVFSDPKNLSTSPEGTPHPRLVGQHDSGGLHKSQVIDIYRMVRRLLLWVQCSLHSLRAVHVPGKLSGHVVPGQCASRGM